MLTLAAFDLAVAQPTTSRVEASRTARAETHQPARTELPPARGELNVGVGAEFGASNWSGDPLAYGGITLGFRLFRIITPYVGGALGYARVDERLLTRITVGLDLGYTFARRVRPHIHGAFVHQHEESLAAVAQEPFGAVLGIGSGIRHRAGVHSGLGVDIRLLTRGAVELSAGPDFSFTYLTYSSGPTWYWVGGVHLTANVRLF